MKNLLLLFALLQLTALVSFAQSDFASVTADANACELNSLHLDGLRQELGNNPTARIIAKVYAGKSETPTVSERRTNYIRKFLEHNKGFDISRVEFVDSGRLDTRENPKAEFYIAQAGEAEGKLYLVTYSRPGETPCLDCCEDGYMPRKIGAKFKPKQKIKRQRKKRNS
ncbi:MAG: hypothetical protein QOE47_1791 [Pyrinomonadaceae bacterium]|nr:hypothetical protein [Pyrinomonadaceae bacterium]